MKVFALHIDPNIYQKQKYLQMPVPYRYQIKAKALLFIPKWNQKNIIHAQHGLNLP